MKDIKLPSELVRLAHILSSHAPLYLVGGAVRDAVMNRKGACDYDICGRLQTDVVKEILQGYDYRLSGEYPRTGTIIISGMNFIAEYTTFRRDSYPIGSGDHRPVEVVFTDDITEDAMRRDFTCNAVYYDIVRQEYIDPVCGISAINRRLLTTTRTPQSVLAEDALRILRMVRFATELGYEVDTECYNVAQEYAPLLADISCERLRVELVKILSVAISERKFRGSRLPSYGIAMLEDMELLGRFYGANISHADLLAMDNLKMQGRYKATLVQYLALLYRSEGTQSAAALLSNLKFPTQVIKDSCVCIEALARLQTLVDLNTANYAEMKLYVQAYYPQINNISGLIIALGLECGELYEALTVVENVGLPLTVKELKIGGNDILSMGAKGAKIGVILDGTLIEALNREVTDRAGQMLIAEEILRRVE